MDSFKTSENDVQLLLSEFGSIIQNYEEFEQEKWFGIFDTIWDNFYDFWDVEWDQLIPKLPYLSELHDTPRPPESPWDDKVCDPKWHKDYQGCALEFE